MNRKWRTLLMFGLGAVLTMSLALPASSAVSATIGSGKVKDNFPLVATVSVTFACPAGAFYNVNLSLFQTQVTDTGTVVTVTGSQNPRSYCTGKTQKINVDVPSNFSSQPWQKGTATARIGFNACSDVCEDFNQEKDIELK
jgi:hypothetical protein